MKYSKNDVHALEYPCHMDSRYFTISGSPSADDGWGSSQETKQTVLIKNNAMLMIYCIVDTLQPNKYSTNTEVQVFPGFFPQLTGKYAGNGNR